MAYHLPSVHLTNITLTDRNNFSVISDTLLKNSEYYIDSDRYDHTIILTSPELSKICKKLNKEGITNLLKKCTEIHKIDYDRRKLGTPIGTMSPTGATGICAQRVYPPTFTVNSMPNISMKDIAERQFDIVTREMIKHEDEEILKDLQKEAEKRKEKSRLQKIADEVWTRTFERWKSK